MVKKTKTSKFKGKVSQNAHKQKTSGAQYGHLQLPKNVSVFKEEAGGRAALDIIPYEVTDSNHPDRDDQNETAILGELWYKRPYRLHRNIGTNNDSAVCPASVGKKCPVCEYRAKLLKEGADYKDESVKALKASLRNLYAVIPKDMKDHEEQIHLWDISQYNFQDALNEELDENEENEVFPDLEEGFTLRIRFSKEELGKNTFAKTSRIDFEKRDKGYNEDMLKQVPNLDSILIIPTYKQLEAKFFELDDEPEPEEEVDESDSKAEEEPDPGKSKGNKGELIEKDMKEFVRKYELDWDELNKFVKPDLKKLAKQYKIDTKLGEKELKEAIADKLNIDIPVNQENEWEDRKTSSSEQNSDNRCPYGYRFGIDTDEYEECDDCDKWEDCIEEKENG